MTSLQVLDLPVDKKKLLFMNKGLTTYTGQASASSLTFDNYCDNGLYVREGERICQQ